MNYKLAVPFSTLLHFQPIGTAVVVDWGSDSVTSRRNHWFSRAAHLLPCVYVPFSPSVQCLQCTLPSPYCLQLPSFAQALRPTL